MPYRHSVIQCDSFGTDLSNTHVTDILKYAGVVCNKAAMLVAVIKEMPCVIYFYCYTVHVVESLNYYTNYCTYIKFTH